LHSIVSFGINIYVEKIGEIMRSVPENLNPEHAKLYVSIRDLMVDEVDIFELIDKGELGLLGSYLEEHPEAIQKRNASNQTPLHLAVSFTDPTFIRLEIIKCLLSHEPELGAKDDEGMTPIHTATKAAFALQALELLVRHALGNLFFAASPDENFLENFSRLIDAQDNSGMTALHYALSRGRLESAECLLIYGASLEICEFTKNATPLLQCFERASNETVEKALGLCFAYSKRQGAKPLNLQIRDKDGNSMLHFACIQRPPSPRLVHALLSFGVNPDIPNNKKEMPITWLHTLHSEESKKIVNYINKPRLVKAEPICLPIFEVKSENYFDSLRDTHSVKRQPIREEQVKSDISSPLRFFARTGKAGENKTPEELLLQFRALLQELSGITTRFHQCGKTIEASDPQLHQQLNCLVLLKRYSCVEGLMRSSAFISELLTVTKRILNHDGSHAFLTVAQFTKLLAGISKKIYQDQNQAAFIDGTVIRDIVAGDQIKTIIGASDKDLATVFSPFKPETMRALNQDQPALSLFRSSLERIWKEHLIERDKNTAVRSFFECIQKYISIIEIAQALFGHYLKNGNDENSAILLLKKLRNEVFENQDTEHSPRPEEAAGLYL
jgi:ankyrin repeat protein